MNNDTSKYVRDRYDNTAEKITSRTRYKRRKVRQKRLVILSCLVVVTIAIVYIVVFALLSSKTELEVIKGTWVYDQYTKYEFDGDGNGCMCLEDLHYKYTYDVLDNKLKLDFQDDAIHDCTYTFELKDNTLTMVGEKGTVGGTYELTKE